MSDPLLLGDTAHHLTFNEGVKARLLLERNGGGENASVNLGERDIHRQLARRQTGRRRQPLRARNARKRNLKLRRRSRENTRGAVTVAVAETLVARTHKRKTRRVHYQIRRQGKVVKNSARRRITQTLHENRKRINADSLKRAHKSVNRRRLARQIKRAVKKNDRHRAVLAPARAHLGKSDRAASGQIRRRRQNRTRRLPLGGASDMRGGVEEKVSVILGAALIAIRQKLRALSTGKRGKRRHLFVIALVAGQQRKRHPARGTRRHKRVNAVRPVTAAAEQTQHDQTRLGRRKVGETAGGRGVRHLQGVRKPQAKRLRRQQRQQLAPRRRHQRQLRVRGGKKKNIARRARRVRPVRVVMPMRVIGDARKKMHFVLLVPRLQRQRESGGDKQHTAGARGNALIQLPAHVNELARHAIVGDNALPHLVGDQHRKTRSRRERVQKFVRLRRERRNIARLQHARKPERGAVNEKGGVRGNVGDSARQKPRLLNDPPAVAAARTMQTDALGHLAVRGARLGGGDVVRRRLRSRLADEKFLGVLALSRARAAENKGKVRDFVVAHRRVGFAAFRANIDNMDSDRNTPGGEKPLPGGGALDAARAFIALRVAILTVSDTRSPDSDKSGDLLAGRIAGAGHVLAARTLVRDDPAQIRAALEDWIRDGAVDVVLTTGGTGVTARDCTPDVVESLLTRRLDGFGEHFRRISSEIIGTSALQSRAVGGVADGTFIFALPGSPSGCRDAWDGVLRWQLDSRVRPCNLAEMLSRL